MLSTVATRISVENDPINKVTAAMLDSDANPYEPASVSSATVSPVSAATPRVGPAIGKLIVRALHGIEIAAWTEVFFTAVDLHRDTKATDFPNQEMALNAELMLICWAGLMTMLAIGGLIRGRGLVLSGPVLASVAVGFRLFVLVPLTFVLLIIASAGFTA